jgi:hypothetical protein
MNTASVLVSVGFSIFFLVLAVTSYWHGRILTKDLKNLLLSSLGFNELCRMATWNYRLELIGFIGSAIASILGLLV